MEDRTIIVCARGGPCRFVKFVFGMFGQVLFSDRPSCEGVLDSLYYLLYSAAGVLYILYNLKLGESGKYYYLRTYCSRDGLFLYVVCTIDFGLDSTSTGTPGPVTYVGVVQMRTILPHLVQMRTRPFPF